MDHTLINPNQVFHYGIPFNDNPYNKNKGINIDVNNKLLIDMYLCSTKDRFDTRVPTQDELSRCIHIIMTSPTPLEPE